MATLATTVTQVVTRTITTSSAAASSTNRANPQGGIFEGRNPTHYEVKNPITLFIIQAVIVIVMTRILHWPLSKLRQPRVIAEVITGIVLGPSIMGRIPNFSKTIFPTESMPAFTLAANIGLVMFLFLVGLEADLRFLISNWRIALSVGAAGMALPFGFGVAIAWGLFHQFHNDDNIVPISFGIYALFIGVALSITAFPVLCRILTSLKLLSSPVGIIVLSAGVANDVVGWILLALCVTLVNSGAGLTALYIFLVAVAYSLFLAYAVRPAFIWILRKSGSLANGPSQGIVALTVFLVLASAFFTDVIGIHAIFGAFMVGLICPHEGGFAIKLTEKIEDLISVLFLPLYFALSGLSTNLGLLDTGMTWAYVVGVTAIAFVAKITGGTLASRLNGLMWRESATIGVLMSCKGLVELIVLNIGLQARILSIRTFTIFVVMALITTFATTPLTSWLYPPWYQEKISLWKQGKIDWDGNPLETDDTPAMPESDLSNSDITSKMLVYLRLDGLPSLFNIVSLFTAGGPRVELGRGSMTGQSDVSSSKHDKTGVHTQTLMLSPPSVSNREKTLRIHGLRMMELTERNSSVMKVSELDEYAAMDPVIKAFGTSTITQHAVRNVAISGTIAVVPDGSFASTLISRARESTSDFVLVPWSESGGISEYPSFFGSAPDSDPLFNSQYSTFISSVFDEGHTVANVGVFIDKSILTRSSFSRLQSHGQSIYDRSTRQLTRSVTGLSLTDNADDPIIFRSADSNGRHQIRALYQGSDDDLLAVKTALQLAKNEEVEVRIVKVSSAPKNAESISSKTTEGADEDFNLASLYSSLPKWIASRVQVEDLESADAQDILQALLVNRNTESGSVTLILGRSSTLAPFVPINPLASPSTGPKALSSSWNHNANVGTASNSEMAKPLGSLAAGMLSSIKAVGGGISLLVVQAKKTTDTSQLLGKQSKVTVDELARVPTNRTS